MTRCGICVASTALLLCAMESFSAESKTCNGLSAKNLSLREGGYYREACATPSQGGQILLLSVKDAGGQTVALDPLSKPREFLEVTLASDQQKMQWLVIVGNDESGNPSGNSTDAAIYSLDKKALVFRDVGTEAYLDDFNDDGRLEIAIFKLERMVSFEFPVGWPMIYKLGESIAASNQKGYPRAFKKFIERAQAVLASLTEECAEIRKIQATCEYDEYMALLKDQLREATGIVDRSDQK